MENCMIEGARASKHCSREACKTCGWNPKIFEKRKQLLERKGLCRCRDGVCRLILPKRKEGKG